MQVPKWGTYVVTWNHGQDSDLQIIQKITFQRNLEWRQQVDSLLKDKPYILPQYDPEAGPIAMVYDDVSPTSVSFTLYYKDVYGVHNELTGMYMARSILDLFGKKKE
ncbi:hypothetical protein [uncultured Brevibacillus sp.]|uniref:hypothetical protein n=1 Tax=uncultured Brevibacillus sp. TaxID=169970 RepID=UPI0025957612|nr:hypothetical protein [uncultured Brevibacillus sp.]